MTTGGVDFFVSYASADRPWAEWIAWELEHAGYRVVIQAWDSRPGPNIALAMHEAHVNRNRIVRQDQEANSAPRELVSRGSGGAA